MNGKWCCIIASDNKKHAGTWVPGQADNLLRGSGAASMSTWGLGFMPPTMPAPPTAMLAFWWATSTDAEVAELLGLGQSLIYSIQSSGLPMMEITLRRGTAAAHYVLGGPQGNDNNAFSLGTAAATTPTRRPSTLAIPVIISGP